MDEKYFKELAASINEIKEKLEFGSIGSLRGPIADPVPDFNYQGNRPPWTFDPWRIRGPIADPVPWELFDKFKIAKLRVHQLDMAISELQNKIKFFEQEKALLKSEYKIK